MILTAAPLAGFTAIDFGTKASALDSTGQCGENVYWSFDSETGTLTISGTGDMYNNGYQFNNNDSIKEVIVSSGVTSIGWDAFYGCTSLTNITIPDSVTSIGEGSFYGCTNLKNITIPDSVTRIDYYTFYGCTSLKSITIPESVTSIGNYTFYGCTSLASVTIGNSVISIGDYAFDGCTSLTSITIPDSVTSIGEGAFFSCTELENINIPDSVISIGDLAFSGCQSLADITISGSLTNISSGLFYGCTNLISIIIPNSITSIEFGAFDGCTNLKSITIPDSVTYINDYSFNGCNNLVITCSNKSYAFYYAIDNEIKVRFDDGGSTLSGVYGRISWVLDVNTETLTISCDGIVPDFASSETLPYTEYGKIIKNIIISEGMTTVNPALFNGLDKIENVTLPSTLQTIGDNTFYNKSSLKNIMIPDSVKSIGSYAFSGCINLTSIIIPNSVTEIGDSAFYGCTSLTSITIPDSVTYIGSSAFYGCKNLTTVTIGNGLTYINYYMFSGCSKLSKLVLGNSVKTIDTGAFRYCTSLSTVVLPASVSYIYNDAFSGATSNIKKIVVYNDSLDISNLDLYTTTVIYANEGSAAHEYAISSGRVFKPLSEYVPDENDYVDPDVQETCKHEYTDTVVEPTCTASGYTTHTCSKCGYSYNDNVVIAPGHSYGDWINDEQPTCVNSGQRHAVCSVCGFEKYELVRAKGHTTVTDNEVPVTCTEDGLTAGAHCSDCGAVFAVQQRIPATGHEMGNWVTVIAPTATTDGTAVSTCRHCGYVESKSLPATGSGSESCDHEFASLVIDATCTQPGYVSYFCTKCGYSYTEKVSALGHTDDNGDGVCDFCSKKMPQDECKHSYTTTVVSPTCVSTGSCTLVCSECGETSTITLAVDKNAHKYGDPTYTATATCITEGELTHTCTLCGHEEKQTISINITNHTGNTERKNASAATCTASGYSGDVYCADCHLLIAEGDEIECTGHHPGEWITDTAAQPGVEGSKHKECTECHTVLETAAIPALPQTNPSVKSVQINDLELKYKSSAKIEPNITADSGAKYTVTYSSSNNDIAKVDENGNVYAAKKGNATITCTVTDSNGNTVTDTCNVKVKYSFGQWLIKIILFGWIWY